MTKSCIFRKSISSKSSNSVQAVFTISTSVVNRCSVVKIIASPPSSHALRSAQILRGFFSRPTDASVHLSLGSEGEETNDWQVRKVSSFQEYTWTNLFYLLQEHLKSWLDDLQMSPKLSHNILQGILQDHMLKVEVL